MAIDADALYGEDADPASVRRLMEELIAAYEVAGKQIQDELETAVLSSFKEFRYRQQLKQIETIIDALNVEVADVIQRGIIDDAYKHGVDIAQTALRKQNIPLKDINLGNQLHTSAIQAVSENMTTDLVSANESMRKNAQTILRKTQQELLEDRAINRTIREGIARGEARRETSDRLLREFQEALGEGKLIKAGNRRYKPEYYAELVARTQTREAVTEGAVRTSLEYGVDLFRFSIHENACPECQKYQGKVYSRSGKTPGFPVLTRRPPIHPHCRHVLTGYVPDPRDEAGLERIKEISNGANVTGIDDYRKAIRGDGPERSQNGIDKRVSQILGGADVNPADKGLIKTRVRQAKFPKSDESMAARVKEGQFADGITNKQYREVVTQTALDKNARVALYQSNAGGMVTMVSETARVVKPELRGASIGKYTAVSYSADNGQVLSVFQMDDLAALPLPETAKWL